MRRGKKLVALKSGFSRSLVGRRELILEGGRGIIASRGGRGERGRKDGAKSQCGASVGGAGRPGATKTKV